MARGRQRTNPFYILLVAIGIAFTVTASAYFVMALRGDTSTTWQKKSTAPGSDTTEVGSDKRTGVRTPPALLGFLDRHGVTLLVAELALLQRWPPAAIGTDSWWSGDRTSPSRTEVHSDDKSR